MQSRAMKTVKTYSNLAEAGFAHSLLEAAGIPAFLADEQSFSLGYATNAIGIRVQVEEENFERALHVLAEGPDAAAAPADAPPVPFPAEPPPKRGMWPVGLFIAIATGAGVLAVTAHWRKFRESVGSTPAGERRYELDYNADGTFDSFSYYEGGRILRAQSDRNFDGNIDEWLYYDREGTIDREEVDVNFDGKVDNSSTYHQGLPATGQDDTNFDGQPDAWFNYRDGVIIASRQDSDFDGSPDMFLSYQHGVLSQTDVRPGDSPIVIRRYLFTHGVLREELVDENAEGTFDHKISYDPFGKRSAPIPISKKR